jgi:O-methyltransferase
MFSSDRASATARVWNPHTAWSDPVKTSQKSGGTAHGCLQTYRRDTGVDSSPQFVHIPGFDGLGPGEVGMNLVSYLKGVSHPFRLKLARMLSRQDEKLSSVLARQVGDLQAHGNQFRIEREQFRADRAQFLADVEQLRQEIGRVQAAVAELRSEGEHLAARLDDAERRLAASEQARREAEAELEQYRHPKWETVLNLMRCLEGNTTWDAAASVVNYVTDKYIGPYHKTLSWGDRLLTLDKAMGLIREPEFQAALNTFRGVHPYDQYDGHDSISWRLNTLVWAAREALGLEGDFVECGVFKGDMAYTIARCLGFAKVPKTYYLYDSFEGFSPNDLTDPDFAHDPGFLEICNKAYRVPGLYESVRDRFVGYPNVRVIRGFLPEALELDSHPKIALLHIDLNSPAAEIGCLEVLFDRLVPGGVLILDDYGWIDFGAQKRAEDAFFAERGYRVLELPTGQGMVVKR